MGLLLKPPLYMHLPIVAHPRPVQALQHPMHGNSCLFPSMCQPLLSYAPIFCVSTLSPFLSTLFFLRRQTEMRARVLTTLLPEATVSVGLRDVPDCGTLMLNSWQMPSEIWNDMKQNGIRMFLRRVVSTNLGI